MDLKISGKRVLVTGGSGGIGIEIARHFLMEGAYVGVQYYRRKERIDRVAQEMLEEGIEVEKMLLPLRADLSIREEAKELVESFVSRFEGVDILVNSHGIVKDNLLMAMTDEEFEEVLNINLTSLFRVTKEVVKYMVIQRWGRIINLSSIAGSAGGRGQSNYSASKGGVEGWTRALSVELAPKGITVNAIAPGIIETEMSKDIIEVAGEEIIRRIPAKRFGHPEDVAPIILFLASPLAGYITGEVIRVSGGFRG